MKAVRTPLVGALLVSVLSACSAGSLNPERTGTAGTVMGSAGTAAGEAGTSGGTSAAGSGGTGGTSGAGGNGGTGGTVGAAGTAGGGASGKGGSAAGAGGTMNSCARGGTGGFNGVSGRGGITGGAGRCASGLPDCVGTGPVCGDGRIDSCLANAQGGLCPKVAVGQACDGADFGQQTCESRGFGSGTLACSTLCTVDASGCRTCTADASLIGCGDAPVATYGTLAMALAATDTEVALAWAEQPDTGPPALRFARLSPNLDLSSAVKLDDPLFAAATDGFNTGVTILAAPLPSGWVVAGYAESEVFVHAVDATGRGVSRIALADVPPGSTILAGRPGGGPLIVSRVYGVARASVISADGRSASAAITLPVDTSAVDGEITAAFVGDAFYVAMAVVNDVTNVTSAHLVLIRVAPDGSSATAIDGLPGTEVWSPYIVEGTDTLRILYAGVLPCVAGYSMIIQSVDRSGAALSPALLFADRSTGWLWRPSAIAFGKDVVTVLAGGDSVRLNLARSAIDGSAAPAYHTIARGPGTFYLGNLARRGPDAIVAWIDDARPEIQLARAAP